MSENLQSVFVACSQVRAVCRGVLLCRGMLYFVLKDMEHGGWGAGVHWILPGKTHLGVTVDDEPATETSMQLSADKM